MFRVVLLCADVAFGAQKHKQVSAERRFSCVVAGCTLIPLVRSHLVHAVWSCTKQWSTSQYDAVQYCALFVVWQEASSYLWFAPHLVQAAARLADSQLGPVLKFPPPTKQGIGALAKGGEGHRGGSRGGGSTAEGGGQSQVLDQGSLFEAPCVAVQWRTEKCQDVRSSPACTPRGMQLCAQGLVNLTSLLMIKVCRSTRALQGCCSLLSLDTTATASTATASSVKG